jgi:hypothetical protein
MSTTNLKRKRGHAPSFFSKLADIDAIRTFWRTTEESFYIPNYL